VPGRRALGHRYLFDRLVHRVRAPASVAAVPLIIDAVTNPPLGVPRRYRSLARSPTGTA
jgi:hypothetical protein